MHTYNPHRTSRNGPVALTGPVLTTATPSRDLKDRSLPNDNDQNHAFSGSKPGVIRNRAHSNVTRNQTFSAARYKAASIVEVKTAIPNAQNSAMENCYIHNPRNITKIEEGRSIYIRGFTDDELTSDLVPRMMECCGEIEGYMPMKEYAFVT